MLVNNYIYYFVFSADGRCDKCDNDKSYFN